MKKNKITRVENWGLISYEKALKHQNQLFEKIIRVKLKNRVKELSNETLFLTPNYLIFCQHPSVYTLGKNGDKTNLLIESVDLKRNCIDFYQTNRGGDITYHGPGQLIVYPIIDLENFFKDIHYYLRLLEEVVIETIAQYSITAGRIDKLTGVWINQKKICAMGIKISRWVTMHGLALNVNTNLTYFDYIIPCGINNRSVTSLEKELKRSQDMEEIQQLLQSQFKQSFGMDFI